MRRGAGKYAFVLLNALLILAVLAGDCLYMRHGTLRLKGTVSAGFVAIGACNTVYALISRGAGLKYPLTMLAGLVFAMLGDVYLGISFFQGVGFFAAGHVLYFASFSALEGLRRRDLLPMAAIMLASVMILKLTPWFNLKNRTTEAVVLGYAVVISGMLGKAVSNVLRRRSGLNLLLAAGSALFYFSDLMLALGRFGNGPDFTGTLCLATYYPAQCLLGLSIYFYVETKRSGICAGSIREGKECS